MKGGGKTATYELWVFSPLPPKRPLSGEISSFLFSRQTVAWREKRREKKEDGRGGGCSYYFYPNRCQPSMKKRLPCPALVPSLACSKVFCWTRRRWIKPEIRKLSFLPSFLLYFIVWHQATWREDRGWLKGGGRRIEEATEFVSPAPLKFACELELLHAIRL